MTMKSRDSKVTAYFRDSETGLDYAVNRYHQSGMGRFLSVDPYKASGGPASPASWNRYAYAGGDPVNLYDPTGRLALTAEYCNAYPNDEECYDGNNNFCTGAGYSRS